MRSNAVLATPAGDTRSQCSPRSRHLGALATQALIAEAELTPKPGLVDMRGPGAHDDLSLELMRRSASVLEPYFTAMAHASQRLDISCGLRAELAWIGREAERAMYKVTHGSNAHKGAIWSLGLLVSAASRYECGRALQIAATAGAIARLSDRAAPAAITHGDIARIRFGATGARGEAACDFPHVVGLGLPMLRARRMQGCSETVARLDALLSIMARLDDTCVLYRGGQAALSLVKVGAHAVLAAGGFESVGGRRRLCTFDRELVARYISPGGSADLLAALIFLDTVEGGSRSTSGSLNREADNNGTA